MLAAFLAVNGYNYAKPKRRSEKTFDVVILDLTNKVGMDQLRTALHAAIAGE